MSGLVQVLLFGVRSRSGSGIKLSGMSPLGFGSPTTSLDWTSSFKSPERSYMIFLVFTLLLLPIPTPTHPDVISWMVEVGSKNGSQWIAELLLLASGAEVLVPF